MTDKIGWRMEEQDDENVIANIADGCYDGRYG